MCFLIRDSKWFLSAIGLEGLNNLLAAYADKSAVAVCTFAYSPGPGHQPIFFKGCCPVCPNPLALFNELYQNSSSLAAPGVWNISFMS